MRSVGRLFGSVVVLGVLATGSLTACGTTPVGPASTGAASSAAPMATPTATGSLAPTPTRAPKDFPTSGGVDYQLGGSYPPPAGTTIVARDSTDRPAAGVYSICYLNGFQTQPQDAAWWLSKHPALVLTTAAGPVRDADWPDEYLLNTATPSARSAIATIESEWIADCATAGFDAVEFDNLDTYSRSAGAISEADNLALATLLVQAAHDNGLLAGQKNSAEFGARGRDVAGFDFAVAEECQRYEECDAYTSVFGDRVIDIEYFDDLGGTLDQVCSDPTLPPMMVFRDRDLVARGDPDYRIEVCG